MRIQHNVKLTSRGRKDSPPKKDWIHVYDNFPIKKLKVGYSFNTGIDYEYGRTIAVKTSCKKKAKKLGLDMKFAVRKWNDKIRVWRIQ